MNKHNSKPRIAIFDYSVCADSAMGGCHLQMMAGLKRKYDFTVFATRFENPDPDHISFVRIPAPARPTILLSIVYHVLAPLYFLIYMKRTGKRFDLIQKTETFTFIGSVAYVHFCHRAYLQKYWRQSKQPGLRGALLTLDHATRAYLLEPIIYRFARKLVVPSLGLERELAEAYPFTQGKIHLLPNFADHKKLAGPTPDFDRIDYRRQLGFSVGELLILFIALGQFERKGLPQLLDAISSLHDTSVKLLVVGGSTHWIDYYGTRASQLGIGEQVAFTGMQRNIAPYLWAADAFALPSLYEVFPLVTLEAAAAACAMLVTRVNGVEDYVVDRVSGIFVDRTAESIASAIREIIDIGPEGRSAMGSAAQAAARKYSLEAFVSNWDSLLSEQLSLRGVHPGPPRKEIELATSR